MFQAPETVESDYPVRFEVAYPEGENRFMILVRWFLAIPHYTVLLFFSLPFYIAVGGMSLILTESLGEWAQWIPVPPIWALIILFTASLPAWLHRYLVGLSRYGYNVGAYVLFHSQYPPITMSAGAYDPVTLELERPASLNRWLPFVKLVLAIPHLVVLFFLTIAGIFVYIFVWWTVLITGRYPRGAFDFLVGMTRWGVRVTLYTQLLTDRYPPFSLK